MICRFGFATARPPADQDAASWKEIATGLVVLLPDPPASTTAPPLVVLEEAKVGAMLVPAQLNDIYRIAINLIN